MVKISRMDSKRVAPTCTLLGTKSGQSASNVVQSIESIHKFENQLEWVILLSYFRIMLLHHANTSRNKEELINRSATALSRLSLSML